MVLCLGYVPGLPAGLNSDTPLECASGCFNADKGF